MTATEHLMKLMTTVEAALDDAECFSSEYHETAQELIARRRMDPVQLRDALTEWAEMLERNAEELWMVLEIVSEYAEMAEAAEGEEEGIA